MRRTTISCDRCEREAEDGEAYWELSFTRAVMVDELTEFTSEGWDLCPECYEAVSAAVTEAVLTGPEESE